MRTDYTLAELAIVAVKRHERRAVVGLSVEVI